MNNKKMLAAKSIVALIFIASCSAVFAGDIGYAPLEGDITVKRLLTPLFGGLIGDAGGADPLVGVLEMFNSALLVLSSFLLAYTIVAGTMQTAHDGEVLGKKWSSMWTPIRMSIGIALIVPIGAGYSMVQYLVMAMVLQGVGIADSMWTKFASGMNDFSQMVVVQNNKKGAEIASIVLEQQMCEVAVNGQAEARKKNAESQNYENKYEGPKPRVLDIDEVMAKNTSAAARGATATVALAKDLPEAYCGTFGWSQKRINTFETAATTAAASKNLGSWFGSTFSIQNFQGSMRESHKSALAELRKDMDSVAKSIYQDRVSESGGSTNESDYAAKVELAINKYNKTIGGAVEGAVISSNMKNDTAKNATRDGWGTAGAWYVKYVRVQNDLTAATTDYPILSSPTTSTDNPSRLAFDEEIRKIVNLVSYESVNGVNTRFFGPQTPKNSSGNKIENALNESLPFGESTWNYFSNTKNGEHRNPLLAAKDFGDNVFTASIIGTFGLSTLVGALDAKLLGSGWGVTAMLAALQPLLFLLSGGLIGFSAMLAFYLPMVPFIIWFGVVIGWLIMVAEAVIAAPLWAVAHLHPDGDGVVGKGGAGYGLILSLTLRPALTILGLICAIVLLDPVGSLFSDIYWGAWASAQEGSTRGLASFVASLVLFATLFVAIIQKIFSLIHVVPDYIMQWIGQNSRMLGGQYGEDLARASSGASTAVGAIAGGAVGKGTNSFAAKAADDKKQKSAEFQKEAELKAQERKTMEKEDKAEMEMKTSGGLNDQESSAMTQAADAAKIKERALFKDAQASIESGEFGAEMAQRFAAAKKSNDVGKMLGMKKEAVQAKTGNSISEHKSAARKAGYENYFNGKDAKGHDIPPEAKAARQGMAETGSSATSYQDAMQKMAQASSGSGSNGGGKTPPGSGDDSNKV